MDTALSEDEGSDARDVLESNGRFILTAAVLSILLTAPVGAIGIAMTGPRWLKKKKNMIVNSLLLTFVIKKNINKIGIIFNTDPHNKSGKHWICLFIDLNKSFISFFEAYAFTDLGLI